MTLLTIEHLLVLGGCVVLAVAISIARDTSHPQRWGSAAFWTLLAIAFIGGKRLPPLAVGYGVLAMTLLTATRQVGVPRFTPPAAEALAAEAGRLRNGLIWPVLLVPAIAIASSFLLPAIAGATWRLLDPRQVSQIGLGLGCVVAFAVALRITRDRPGTAVVEGGRLLQLLGWTLLLPPMLAALGGIFARAGVGEVIAGYVAQTLPVDNRIVAVVAYCGAMALFTILLGNAFAAFPVITLGVGLPFIVKQHGGDPAIMGALGMLSGYCGTLVTPMAANFNLVPVKLLELPDDNAVIKTQAPMAAAIWIFNVVVMAACVYRS